MKLLLKQTRKKVKDPVDIYTCSMVE